jgi:HSP20 family molecular chaperone IbpA
MPELMPAERHTGGTADGRALWPGAPAGAQPRPFGEFEELLDRLVSRSRGTPDCAEVADRWTPVAGLEETTDGWVVEIEFPPGIDAGDIESRFAGRVLTVRVPRPASRAGGRELS